LNGGSTRRSALQFDCVGGMAVLCEGLTGITSALAMLG
jgi:hypothetical protein